MLLLDCVYSGGRTSMARLTCMRQTKPVVRLQDFRRQPVCTAALLCALNVKPARAYTSSDCQLCAVRCIYRLCVPCQCSTYTCLPACLRLIRSANITAYTSLVFCVSVGCYVTSSLPSNELLLLLVPGRAVTSSPLPLVSRHDG